MQLNQGNYRVKLTGKIKANGAGRRPILTVFPAKNGGNSQFDHCKGRCFFDRAKKRKIEPFKKISRWQQIINDSSQSIVNGYLVKSLILQPQKQK